jgi:hypothetical protein
MEMVLMVVSLSPMVQVTVVQQLLLEFSFSVPGIEEE